MVSTENRDSIHSRGTILMKKLLALLFILSIFTSVTYSDEVITGFEDKDKVVLNEELRQIRKGSERIDTRVDTLESTNTIENRTDDPTSPATGRIWFRTDL